MPSHKAPVCRMILALQDRAGVTVSDLCADAEYHADGVRRWLRVMEQHELVELIGRGPKPRTGSSPYLWRWRDERQ